MHHNIRPHLYLDTNVVLDAVMNRPKGQASREVIDRIARHSWLCSTSRFAFVEMLDEVQRQRKRQTHKSLDYPQLNRIYDRLEAELMENYAFIEFEYPSRKEFWATAEIICGVTNLRAPDSLHLATAWGGLCDVIVTNDRRWVRVAAEEVPIRFQIPTILPQDIDNTLRDLGFTIDNDGQATRGTALQAGTDSSDV